MKKKTKKNEYVIVPVSWFESMLKIKDETMLRGYLSSANTILKYLKRVDEDFFIK